MLVHMVKFNIFTQFWVDYLPCLVVSCLKPFCIDLIILLIIIIIIIITPCELSTPVLADGLSLETL